MGMTTPLRAPKGPRTVKAVASAFRKVFRTAAAGKLDVDRILRPAEYFVENGLKIKERAWPRRALVVELANGFIGYVPHREAFLRGGYETTFCGWSKLAPEAGDILAEQVLELIRPDRQGGPDERD
jgi:hypothetical protein